MKNTIKMVFHKIALFCSLFFALYTGLLAQNLALSGIITFERKENMHKQFTEDDSWTEARMKQMPKYKMDIFQLSFNSKQSVYKITTEDENPMFSWMKVANANTVNINLEKKQVISEKTIFEETFHITDSIPVYQWKMLGEYREVAGYTCRKAATIIMDSLYIIAFYTDEIPVSSGPESVTGLPGMILGVVIPRLNLTYFATKVETQILPETTFEISKSKSKKVNLKTYNEELGKAMKDWDEFGNNVMWKANL